MPKSSYTNFCQEKLRKYSAGIKVREKRIEDEEAIANIVLELPEWFTPDVLAHIKEDVKKLPGYVVEINGKVRGFVLLEERDCCVEIKWLAVARNFHRKGIGGLILKKVEEYAEALNKPLITVKTYGGMDYEPYKNTYTFYKKYGFKLYEIIEHYAPFGGQPAAILVKAVIDTSNRLNSPGR